MRDLTKLKAFKLADEVVILVYQLILSKRLGLLCEEDASMLEPKLVESGKVLNGLIRSIRNKK